jgi:rhodanese-related sulfurtransferase
MIESIKRLLGFGPKVDYKELMQNGAQIIDVRSKEEFKGGHIKGSINIPLDQLSTNLGKISKTKPAILCCASGMRSSSAKSILKSNGYSDVHNGGAWVSLQGKLK